MRKRVFSCFFLRLLCLHAFLSTFCLPSCLHHLWIKQANASCLDLLAAGSLQRFTGCRFLCSYLLSLKRQVCEKCTKIYPNKVGRLLLKSGLNLKPGVSCVCVCVSEYKCAVMRLSEVALFPSFTVNGWILPRQQKAALTDRRNTAAITR